MADSFTPGPWHAVQDPGLNSSGRYTIVNTAGTIPGQPGAHFVADVRGPGLPWPQSEESTANARLIAAAPELLAACEGAIKAIRDSSFDRYAGAALEPAYTVMKAAIAKAKG